MGDLIDRGEQGVETVRIVRAMVDAGSAQAVMGNHELNAVAWHTPDPLHPGDYLRPRFREPWGPRNAYQHRSFLDQVEADPALHAELVDWFMTLPLWLDVPSVRVVHACWHGPTMQWLAPQLRDGRFLTRELLAAATTPPADDEEKDTPEPSVFKAVETITKGIEVPLPAPHGFKDKDGFDRQRLRIAWWPGAGTTYREAALEDSVRQAGPTTRLPAHVRLHDTDPRPVFFGHYWMRGAPRIQAPTAVCVDYSAGKGGPLMAYRFDAGEPLSKGNFAWADQGPSS